jgi:hypothetical protein
LSGLGASWALSFCGNDDKHFRLFVGSSGVFARSVFGFLRRMSGDYGIDRTQCGAVTFIQRFGGSMN